MVFTSVAPPPLGVVVAVSVPPLGVVVVVTVVVTVVVVVVVVPPRLGPCVNHHIHSSTHIIAIIVNIVDTRLLPNLYM